MARIKIYAAKNGNKFLRKALCDNTLRSEATEEVSLKRGARFLGMEYLLPLFAVKNEENRSN